MNAHYGWVHVKVIPRTTKQATVSEVSRLLLLSLSGLMTSLVPVLQDEVPLEQEPENSPHNLHHQPNQHKQTKCLQEEKEPVVTRGASVSCLPTCLSIHPPLPDVTCMTPHLQQYFQIVWKCLAACVDIVPYSNVFCSASCPIPKLSLFFTILRQTDV